MDDEHYGREMPYHCRLCRYRSSLYDDIWNHFLLVSLSFVTVGDSNL